MEKFTSQFFKHPKGVFTKTENRIDLKAGSRFYEQLSYYFIKLVPNGHPSPGYWHRKCTRSTRLTVAMVELGKRHGFDNPQNGKRFAFYFITLRHANGEQ